MNLTRHKLAQYFDHTLLKAQGQESEILTLCQEALEWEFCAVCVLPRWVPFVASQLKNQKVKICTVVGFPLGGNSLRTKEFEALNSLENGAQEIDMVIDSGAFKSGDFKQIEKEIYLLQKIATTNEACLKVILETSLWETNDLLSLTKIARDCGADFVKTSTGFSNRGATLEDIRTMQTVVEGSKTQIKASGGIKNLDFVLNLIQCGANRIGSSSSVSIMKEFLNRV